MSIAPASSRGDRCWVGNMALERGLPLTGLPESDSHGSLGGVGPKPSRIKSCGGARVNKSRRKRVLAITVKKGAKERGTPRTLTSFSRSGMGFFGSMSAPWNRPPVHARR